LPLSAPDAINPAFQHVKQQLTQPFRFGQWVRLAFVGLLAGELSSGGGCNSSFHVPSTHHPHGAEHFVRPFTLPPLIAHHLALFVAAIAFLIVIGISLSVLFLYIGSVMRFILFDSVLAKECHIRQGWAHRRRYGLRLFVWQIYVLLAFFASFLVLIGIPLAGVLALHWLPHPGGHVLPLVLGGTLLFLILVVIVLVLAAVNVMTKDFVVPQMALEDISAMEGWRRLWLLLKAEKLGYIGYIGMKVVLAIGANIVLGLVSLIVLLAILVPMGGIGVVAVLAGKAVGLTWTFYTITLAVIAACLAVAVFIFVFSIVSVPAIVFFPAYSIYFFAPRYAPLASVLWPQALVSPADGAPPPDATSLP
jgi:hypothetical protein